LVVARVRAQFRRALVEVADLQVLFLVPKAANPHGQREHHGYRCHHRVGHIRQQAPERVLTGRIAFAVLYRRLADTQVGNGHGQQDQVGEDDDRHADGGADSQFMDHAYIDNQQRDEAHRIGQDGDHPRQEQLTEGQPRGGQGIVRTAGMLGDTVDFLHTMGNTDGEDQERYKHRIRVDAKADQVHQAQLPDHRDQRGDQHGNGTAHAVGEQQQQHHGDQEGDAKEQHHHHQAVDQVADLLGEADNVDFHIGVLRLVFGSNFFFQVMGETLVVQLQDAALVLRVGKGFQQRHVDDARLEIVGHQAADLPRREDVAAQFFEAGGGAVIGLGNHFATVEALLGDFSPAHAGTPQRLQPGAVDALDVKHLVMDLPQRFHVLLAENIAILGGHGDTHGIAEVGQVIAKFEHLLDVRMLQWNHFLETGRGLDLQGLEAQKKSNHQAGEDHHQPVIENKPFKQTGVVLAMRAHEKSPVLLLFSQLGSSAVGAVDATLSDQ